MAKTAHHGPNPSVRHHDHPLVTVAATGDLDRVAPDPGVAAHQVGAVAALAATETDDLDRAALVAPEVRGAAPGRAVVAPDPADLDPRAVAPLRSVGS